MQEGMTFVYFVGLKSPKICHEGLVLRHSLSDHSLQDAYAVHVFHHEDNNTF